MQEQKEGKMIHYSKGLWGLPHLGKAYGSAFPRGLFFTLLGALLTSAWEYSCGSHRCGYLRVGDHPFPFSLLASAVAFILTFRNNFAYHRFWEGRTQLQLMDSKWIDVATQAIYFDRGTVPSDATDEQIEACRDFCETFSHLMSLLHALALQNLRRDWDLDNLIHHHEYESKPDMNIRVRRRMKHQEIRSELKERGLSRWRRFMVYLWAGRHSFPIDMFHIQSNRLQRECYNNMLPLGVIGGVSKEEKLILGEDAKLGPVNRRDTSYMVCSSLTTAGSGQLFPGPGERVHIVNDWIHTLIMERRRAGGLDTPPPILTRMFAIMSQGMEGYENCRKLADTPFPFPYSQLVIGMLMMFMSVTPFLFGGFVLANPLSIAFNFLTLVTHFALNELAKDLEDPFIHDPNDLPLVRHHYNFNERLLAVSRSHRPVSNVEKHNISFSRSPWEQDDAPQACVDEVQAPLVSFTDGKLEHYLSRFRRCRGNGEASASEAEN